MVYLLDRECTSSEIRNFDDFDRENSPKSDPELIQNPRITFACLGDLNFVFRKNDKRESTETKNEANELKVQFVAVVLVLMPAPNSQ